MFYEVAILFSYILVLVFASFLEQVMVQYDIIFIHPSLACYLSSTNLSCILSAFGVDSGNPGSA
jgi:hypothetical protein